VGDLSPHFSRSEFRCKHCGALVGPDAQLVDVLEYTRALTGRPLRVVSGYRCPTHNARVGGVPSSQHVHGTAADIPPGRLREDQARAFGATGIGLRGEWVVHVDVRSRKGPPAVWKY
jgi:uncharacterized protein YcbK (DUF882 family)